MLIVFKICSYFIHVIKMYTLLFSYGSNNCSSFYWCFSTLWTSFFVKIHVMIWSLTETYAQVYKGVECNYILLSSLWLAIHPSSICYPSDRLPVTLRCYYPYLRSSIKVKNTQGHSIVNAAPIKKRRMGLVVFIKQIMFWQFPI